MQDLETIHQVSWEKLKIDIFNKINDEILYKSRMIYYMDWVNISNKIHESIIDKTTSIIKIILNPLFKSNYLTISSLDKTRNNFIKEII